MASCQDKWDFDCKSFQVPETAWQDSKIKERRCPKFSEVPCCGANRVEWKVNCEACNPKANSGHEKVQVVGIALDSSVDSGAEG